MVPFLIALTLATAAPSTDAASLDARIAVADRAMARGDYHAALADYVALAASDAAAAGDPRTFARLKLREAIAAYRLGRDATASRALSAVRALPAADLKPYALAAERLSVTFVQGRGDRDMALAAAPPHQLRPQDVFVTTASGITAR